MRAAFVAPALVASFAATAAAQQRPRRPSALERQALLLAAAPLIQRGYQPSEGAGIAGSLNSGATWSRRFDFLPGERVALVAVCDSNCTDLVMRLRDASGNDAATDVAPGGRAILEFTVSATPEYALTIEMAACGRNPCRWAFFSLLRP